MDHVPAPRGSELPAANGRRHVGHGSKCLPMADTVFSFSRQFSHVRLAPGTKNTGFVPNPCEPAHASAMTPARVPVATRSLSSRIAKAATVKTGQSAWPAATHPTPEQLPTVVFVGCASPASGRNTPGLPPSASTSSPVSSATDGGLSQQDLSSLFRAFASQVSPSFRPRVRREIGGYGCEFQISKKSRELPDFVGIPGREEDLFDRASVRSAPISSF